MDKIPDYAIVSPSVDITKLFFPKYSKLTNALLRNVANRNFEFKKPNIGDSIFKTLKGNIGTLNKYSKNNLCKLIEIVFRLKDKINKGQRYFINFDLLYHKLK